VLFEQPSHQVVTRDIEVRGDVIQDPSEHTDAQRMMTRDCHVMFPRIVDR